MHGFYYKNNICSYIWLDDFVLEKLNEIYWYSYFHGSVYQLVVDIGLYLKLSNPSPTDYVCMSVILF